MRNEKAEYFLSLLQQWDALCKKYGVQNSNYSGSDLARTLNEDEDDENEPLPKGTFEVEKLVDICYGDPNSTGEVGLWFKVLQILPICVILIYVSFYTCYFRTLLYKVCLKIETIYRSDGKHMMIVMIRGSQSMAFGWYFFHYILLYFILSIVPYPS